MSKEYPGITREELKKVVDYVFKEQPREKIKKGDKSQPYISVYQNEDTLSFKWVNCLLGLTTGIGGMINIFNQKGGSLMVLYPIVFNGRLLGEEANEAFWKEFSEIKEKYERKQLKNDI